jgi:hypothetical protein
MQLIKNQAYTAEEIYKEIGEKPFLGKVQDTCRYEYEKCLFVDHLNILHIANNFSRIGKSLHSYNFECLRAVKKREWFFSTSYALSPINQVQYSYIQCENGIYISVHNSDTEMFSLVYKVLPEVGNPGDCASYCTSSNIIGEVSYPEQIFTWLMRYRTLEPMKYTELNPYLAKDLQRCAFSGKMNPEFTELCFETPPL